MNGYFITLYDKISDLMTEQNIVGYLYCCEVNGCNNIMKVATKVDKLVCSKCGKKIEDG